ncbi:MAG: hypothetical protein ACLU9Y_09170 [Thomasclavelia ramosa]
MKYKLTNKKIDYLGRTLYQIEAVKKFGNIAKGQKGGFIEKKSNLSQDGNAWVYNYAMVYGNAKVRDNAKVYDCAMVRGDAVVCDNAIVRSNSDYLIIGPIDSHSGTTTFFKTSDKDNAIKVACGCFTGDIDAFQKKVIKTHGNNNYAKEYKLAIEIAKIHILGKQK